MSDQQQKTIDCRICGGDGFIASASTPAICPGCKGSGTQASRIDHPQSAWPELTDAEALELGNVVAEGILGSKRYSPHAKMRAARAAWAWMRGRFQQQPRQTRTLADRDCCRECRDCDAKPGSPQLCDDCLRRRDICSREHGKKAPDPPPAGGEAPRELAALLSLAERAEALEAEVERLREDAELGRLVREMAPGSSIEHRIDGLWTAWTKLGNSFRTEPDARAALRPSEESNSDRR